MKQKHKTTQTRISFDPAKTQNIKCQNLTWTQSFGHSFRTGNLESQDLENKIHILM